MTSLYVQRPKIYQTTNLSGELEAEISVLKQRLETINTDLNNQMTELEAGLQASIHDMASSLDSKTSGVTENIEKLGSNEVSLAIQNLKNFRYRFSQRNYSFFGFSFYILDCLLLFVSISLDCTRTSKYLTYKIHVQT